MKVYMLKQKTDAKHLIKELNTASASMTTVPCRKDCQGKRKKRQKKSTLIKKHPQVKVNGGVIVVIQQKALV